MIELDQINQNILHELELDARISNIDLSRKVSLSPSACLRRVQELERSRVIQGYRAVINPAVRGAEITIFVLVGLSEHLKKDAQAFERAMARSAMVRECHTCARNLQNLLWNLAVVVHSDDVGMVEAGQCLF